MIARGLLFAALAGSILIGDLAPNLNAAPAPPSASLQCSAAATMATPSTPGPAPQDPSTPAPAGASPLRVLSDIPVPGSASRFDYQSLDATTGRLYVAHMGADQLVVFDTASQHVAGTVNDVKTPTGVLAVPELGRVFVAASGSHDVAVIDAQSLQVIAHVGRIGFPDGLDYAPAVKQVFVSDESGGGELVIDATTNKAVTTIDIGGEAGNTHYDPGSGCILVVVQSANQLAAIDPTTDRLVGRYDLAADCQKPHGFLVDASRRRAFVTCEDNALLLVVDLPSMAVAAKYPVGGSPDVLAFDPGLHRLYVASESGVVSVFAVKDGLTPIGLYQALHAHSVAVDPAAHLVYLPLESVDGKPVVRILEPTPTG